MLLAIDIGNTHVVCAIHNGKKWIQTLRIPSNFDFWNQFITLKLNGISDAAISSVVPGLLPIYVEAIKNIFHIDPFIIDYKNAGVELKVDHPEEVGSDRICNAAAVQKLAGVPAIVGDFGSASNYDVVNKNGTYNGGIIAPGVNLSLKSLVNAADQIPIFSIKKQKKIIGKNTIEALRSGFYWGYTGLIYNIILKIEKETKKKYKIIFTGGYADLFKKAIKRNFIIDKNITMKGIIEIFKANRKDLMK